MTIKYPSHKNVIRPIAEGVSAGDGFDATIRQKFIQYFYSYTSSEDLSAHSSEQLCAMALSHLRLMADLSMSEIKVKVFNPTLENDGWVSPHTIVQVVLEDRPFLVDSLRMEITRLNLNYFFMVHMGGMVVVRDEHRKIIDIERYKGQEVKAGQVESPIYIEIDRQNDATTMESIRLNLLRVLKDVCVAVTDWPKMCDKMREVIAEMQAQAEVNNSEEASESIAFLTWLLENNFTFLGVRDYDLTDEGERSALRLVPGSGLGVLSDETTSKKVLLFSDLPEQARLLLLSEENRIFISKTNTISTVHRPVYTDYVGVKRINKNNKLVGERRFIGLYTSTAYSSDPQTIPLLRHKVSYVLKKSQLPKNSHSGKDLQHILATLPRDDLFQANTAELYQLAMGILQMQERRCIRLFAREDAYGRYISCLVYLPRETFNTKLLQKIRTILMESFDGIEASFNTFFSTSVLSRLHFIVRITPNTAKKYDLADIERQLIEAGKSWQDEFYEQVIEHFGDNNGANLYVKYRDAFAAGYREMFKPQQAVYDMEHIEQLKKDSELGMTVYRPAELGSNGLKFKLFCLAHTIPLSDALPILENLGFRVLSEEPYEIHLPDQQIIWINDFTIEYIYSELPKLASIRQLFEEAFLAVWQGQSENDKFNHLIVCAGFSWREVVIFRAYSKYLQQLGSFPFSLHYIAETFIHNPKVAEILLKIFQSYFDPMQQDQSLAVGTHEKQFFTLLDSVASLDEDRTFRAFFDLIKATLRTNFYQIKTGTLHNFIAFKLSPKDIPGVPLPLPAYEIFVYSPDFEGVHLRMAKVARGGIRWSDRREDFRTEVLGLMKAQQVKNSVIVPSGAKGGFVVKKIAANKTRDEIFQEGVRCYQGFIAALLSITDNFVNGALVHPENVVLRDDDDPYLVVAADKGTATFSDIANQISLDANFWLGDAFASGGSAGYDHKKMAITARGAWISAERQFQELGIYLNEAPVTVIGIGDMAGDVFGNGALLSSHMKLVAAFNHMHIFIDPNPDPALSFEERKRLFNLPRSTWADYSVDLISKGGGIFLRSAKSIKLTDEIRALIGLPDEELPPNALIRALLKAPVDMIWNGGIGTFIKSTTESHPDAGDRSNDMIRINGNEVRAKIVCEGGNLGVTQLGRIEYELNGGKINTDFIDNSAGVDCSDHEVNIKILFSGIISKGDVTLKQRNQLLLKMTDEVAELVLQDNYHQNEALSLAAFSSADYIDVYRRFITSLEESGNLNRALEFLPTDKMILDRKSANLGLTKPELAVLLAYAKIVVEEEFCHSSLVNDPYFQCYAKKAFPKPLRERFLPAILTHPLYREIVATQVSNRMISDMGITFVYTMYDETGADLNRIISAYIVSHTIFHMEKLYADIESLDYKIDTHVQYAMMLDIVRLVRRATRWFLRNRREQIDIQATIDLFSASADDLYKKLPKLLNGSDKERHGQRYHDYIASGVPSEIAFRVASTDAIYHVLNIIEVSRLHDVDYSLVAKTYFAIIDRLDLLWFRDLIDTYPNDTHWMILAKASYKGDLDWVQREITLSVLKLSKKAELTGSIHEWVLHNKGSIDRWESVLERLRGAETREFAMLAVAIRELSEIAQVL